jgi:hypothetical protein
MHANSSELRLSRFARRSLGMELGQGLPFVRLNPVIENVGERTIPGKARVSSSLSGGPQTCNKKFLFNNDYSN